MRVLKGQGHSVRHDQLEKRVDGSSGCELGVGDIHASDVANVSA